MPRGSLTTSPATSGTGSLATACRDHCLGTLGFERVISLVRPENVPSCRVAEKIGMTVEREIDWHDLRHRVYATRSAGA